jgi:hypothetical protein
MGWQQDDDLYCSNQYALATVSTFAEHWLSPAATTAVKLET